MKLRSKLIAGLAFLVVGGAALAQTNFQFPNTPWQAYAPTQIQCGKLSGANFNVTTDQAITISVPSGAYFVSSIAITEPSVSMTTAAGGFYSAASKGGVCDRCKRAGLLVSDLEHGQYGRQRDVRDNFGGWPDDQVWRLSEYEPDQNDLPELDDPAGRRGDRERARLLHRDILT
jgi:hypothetical protein